MTVHRWKDIKRPTPPEAAARVAAEMEAELLQLNLQELRQRRGVTQQDLAAAMGTHQAGLSRAERQSDHLVSTLKAYVEALGGRLELRAIFNDGQAIELITG